MTDGYDPAYGARPMRRSIQRLIQDPLSLRLLAGEFLAGETIVVDRDGDSGQAEVRETAASRNPWQRKSVVRRRSSRGAQP